MVKVAVIGGGAAGLAAVSYLLQERGVEVELFEERTEYGGVWTNESTRAQHPPMYDGLETNVPHTLMTFTDHPWPTNTPVFPPHETVREYLRSYAEKWANNRKLRTFFDAKVTKLQQIGQGRTTKWRISATGTFRNIHRDFDRVVVATGNYTDPYVPDREEGRNVWEQRGRPILHSSQFRDANPFRGKRVLVVGNGPSGWDITERIAAVAEEVVVSLRTPQPIHDLASRAVGKIRRYDSDRRTIYFTTGAAMPKVDVVIYCTGFIFNYPFAMGGASGTEPLFEAGFKVRDLYEHMFYIPEPSLAFVGLPKMAASFTVPEAQSAVIARVFSGRIALPSTQMMVRWKDEHAERQVIEDRPASSFHTLSNRLGEDKEYVNRLCMVVLERQTLPTLGKQPPYWCNCLDSAKANVGAIRTAFKAKGDDKYLYRTYHLLGFNLDIPCTSASSQDHPTIGATTCFLDLATRCIDLDTHSWF